MNTQWYIFKAIYGTLFLWKQKAKQTLYSPEQTLRLLTLKFPDSRHMKAVRLSALHTGHLYPPRKYSWYSVLLEAESNPVP